MKGRTLRQPARLSKKSRILLSCFLFCLSACPGISSSIKNDSQNVSSAQTLTEAIVESGRVISGSLDTGVSVAIISITSSDLFEGEYALEELTIQLVNARKFRVVDRHNLDIIRAEQQLHISGEVDDETAVSIGHLIGTAYVITGRISLRDSVNYLRLRAIDVETGQIKIMTSVSYGGN